MASFDKGALVDVAKTSYFSQTYESIGTMRMGLATPVLHKEIVPKDEVSLSINDIMRLAPMQSPVFDDLSLHFRAFFCPNRILDPEWKRFITGGVGLAGTSDEEIKNLSFTLRSLVSCTDGELRSEGAGTGSSAAGRCSVADWLNLHFVGYDSLGYPTESIDPDIGIGEDSARLRYANTSTQELSILPFLGYQKVFDDWYRNERVQPERLPEIHEWFKQNNTRVFDADNSVDDTDSVLVNPFHFWRVNYGKDRYTTALPEPTIGGDVTYPIGVDGGDYTVSVEGNPVNGYKPNSNIIGRISSSGSGAIAQVVNDRTGLSNLVVSLSSSVAATIQNLKASFKFYDFFMKDTYGGNRYVEYIQNHFDVTVPDATLDRAIYLGDTKVRVSFGEVFQTSQGDGSADSGSLGDYAGRGAAYVEDGYMFKSFFREHGQLYVIASIVPTAKYYQGIDRKFFKDGRFAYFHPEFQNIGDDVLYTSELYNTGSTSQDMQKVFGFNSRWINMKESLDEVHGDFLDNMNDYHFGRQFLDEPQIGESFIQVPTINRPFAVTDSFSSNYLLNMQFRLGMQRPMVIHESF